MIKPIYKLGLINLISISHANKKSLDKVIGVSEVPIVYNGRKQPVKSKEFDLTVKSVGDMVKITNPKLFVHIGRCSKQKNQRVLLEAFNKFRLKHPDSFLLIFGGGFDSKRGLFLKKIAGSGIFFMGTTKNIIDYLILSNSFLLSSSFEGMPISLIEALACGCVPISTPTSGAIDVLQNGINGYITEGFSSDDFYKTLSAFPINNSEKLSLNSIKTYNMKFSIEKCSNEYLRLYKIKKEV